MKKNTLSIAVITALMSTSVSAFDFHGYARSAVGISNDGDMQELEPAKVGRLGQPDTFVEIGLGKELWEQDGKSFYFDTLFAYAPGQSAGDWEEVSPSFRQVNMQARNFFGEGTTAWIGKRYNQRHDVYHLDWYYWNASAPSVGIEGVDLGTGKGMFAITRTYDKSAVTGTNSKWDICQELNDCGVGVNPGDPYEKQIDETADFPVYHLDMRWSEIPLWTDSQLELGFDYALPYLTSEVSNTDHANYSDKGGVALTLEQTQGNFYGGFNKFVVQWGNNGQAAQIGGTGAVGYDYGYDVDDVGASAFRILNHGVVALNERWESGYAAYYFQGSRDNSEDTNGFSISARPIYKWSEHNRTSFELGYFSGQNTEDYWLKDDVKGKDKEKIGKFTIAQTWAPSSSYWAKPEMRIFASYLKDFEGDSFRDDKDYALNIGAQFEVWW
ncbi:maltoporin [Alginatibacterium sediminis]|uniref:Maltoporin n=1 Tax=Alginatibacterium sediminis TaxID=2164068 RepID=A0A420E868_9ALTE|nr:carbohydrate porin [Alginatibacterium sediminis]RKF15676.1 maltoporin [Alginatibacterium sediminis]